MDFSFGEDQLAMRDQVRAVLADLCPPSAVRRAWSAGPGGTDRRAWTALVALGAVDVLVAESDGGLGLDETSIVLPLEEAGYAGLPDPLVETAAVAMPLLAGRVPAGAVIATDLGGPLVPWAADADRLLLTGPEGALHLVDPADARIDPVDSVDGARRPARVSWDPALSCPPVADDAARREALARGWVGTAALLVGLSRRMLDMTVAHVTGRHQFGAAVGSFQAVKHQLADAATRLEFARPVVYRGAWSLARRDADRAVHASMAKAMASDTAAAVGRAALQCHGAIGYTVEYDLHLFLKRAAALARGWGDAAAHRHEVGRSLGV